MIMTNCWLISQDVGLLSSWAAAGSQCQQCRGVGSQADNYDADLSIVINAFMLEAVTTNAPSIFTLNISGGQKGHIIGHMTHLSLLLEFYVKQMSLYGRFSPAAFLPFNSSCF